MIAYIIASRRSLGHGIKACWCNGLAAFNKLFVPCIVAAIAYRIFSSKSGESHIISVLSHNLSIFMLDTVNSLLQVILIQFCKIDFSIDGKGNSARILVEL
jgi:hypothetical protein